MLTNIKAAIFDMDGTLIDSMWVWERIDVEYLAGKGFDVPPNLREEIEPMTFAECAVYFKNTFSLKESIEEIMQEWNDMAYEKYENEIKLKPHAKDFLDYLKKNNIRLAIATSNYMPLVEIVLKNNNVYDYFDFVTVTDEVDRGKSFPDIYLLSAEKLGVKPCECVVFEDILAAVNGAKAAGMTVVGVYDLYSEHQKFEMKDVADKYILDFDELIPCASY